MSRAFTKEDDSGGPLVVPARAPLPAGSPNYVTSRGLLALRGELAGLLGRRADLLRGALDTANAGILAALAQRIADLEVRLASAEVVRAQPQQRDEIRFGAEVTLRTASGDEKKVRIVGADEADPAKGCIAFFSPLARGLLGKKRGDTASVRTPHGEEEVDVIRIDYDGDEQS